MYCMYVLVSSEGLFSIYGSIETTGQGVLDAGTACRLLEHRTLYTASISTRGAGGLDSK